MSWTRLSTNKYREVFKISNNELEALLYKLFTTQGTLPLRGPKRIYLSLDDARDGICLSDYHWTLLYYIYLLF